MHWRSSIFGLGVHSVAFSYLLLPIQQLLCSDSLLHEACDIIVERVTTLRREVMQVHIINPQHTEFPLFPLDVLLPCPFDSLLLR